MNRRSTIQSLGIISAHALFPGILANFVLSCQRDQSDLVRQEPTFFDAGTFQALPALIDRIIPATQTQSASETGVHYFLDEIFEKCLPPALQDSLQKGITKLVTDLQSATDPEAFLTEVDQKAYSGNSNYAFFIPLKQYTLVGFFTSQEGMTKASNYVKVPGEYQGDIEADENTLNYGKTDMRYYL